MTLPKGYSRIIDLTLPISERHPSHWPTHLPFQHKTYNWYENTQSKSELNSSKHGPYATKWMAIDEHTGTHMDAPSHFIPPKDSGLEYANEWGEVGVDGIPLTQMMGPAVVIDMKWYETENGISPLTTADDIRKWEAENRDLDAGDIVLLRSGWDENYKENAEGNSFAFDVFIMKSKPAWCAPNEDAIDYLIDKGIKCIGTDGPTMGPAQGGQGVHIHALGRGGVFIECLSNLDQLPSTGAYFMFLPIKVLNATGSPGRAIAFLE